MAVDYTGLDRHVGMLVAPVSEGVLDQLGSPRLPLVGGERVSSKSR